MQINVFALNVMNKNDWTLNFIEFVELVSHFNGLEINNHFDSNRNYETHIIRRTTALNATILIIEEYMYIRQKMGINSTTLFFT